MSKLHVYLSRKHIMGRGEFSVMELVSDNTTEKSCFFKALGISLFGYRPYKSNQVKRKKYLVFVSNYTRKLWKCQGAMMILQKKFSDGQNNMSVEIVI